MATKPYQIPGSKKTVEGASPARGKNMRETISERGSPNTPDMPQVDTWNGGTKRTTGTKY